jgi:hypothetical protein
MYEWYVGFEPGLVLNDVKLYQISVILESANSSDSIDNGLWVKWFKPNSLPSSLNRTLAECSHPNLVNIRQECHLVVLDATNIFECVVDN